MALSQSTDFSWYKPVEARDEETIGSYVGEHEALNITGADPDYKYYYQRFSRNRSDAVIRFLNKGWTVVGPDDNEKFGTDRISWKSQTPLGTERAYGDLVLMKIPMSLYRQQQEQRKEQQSAMLNDLGPRFEELGHERAQQLRHKPKAPLYYLGRDHGQTIEDL